MTDRGASREGNRPNTFAPRSAGIAQRTRGLFAGALVAAIVAGGAVSPPVRAQSTSPPSPPVKEVATTVVPLDPGRGSGVYPLYISADIRAGNAAARQPLVILHGRLRNAADYFATGLALVKQARTAGAATIVVAPQLLNQSDVTARKLPDRYLRWDRDWEAGMPALGPSPASSYDVLDDVVAKLSNPSTFPELKRIVFIGHGGGAQLLARYAAVTRADSSRAISFVIANSGTYLYLTAERPLPVPPTCADFNAWKYGLNNPPAYVVAPDTVLKNFATRDVTLLLGTRDKKSDGILDQSCAAQTQGSNRFDRGQRFLAAVARNGLAPRLKYAIVPGVGHDEKSMLFSIQARQAIFDGVR
jgi:pimeloyl-ACP methyl ester carboxylesterase